MKIQRSVQAYDGCSSNTICLLAFCFPWLSVQIKGCKTVMQYTYKVAKRHRTCNCLCLLFSNFRDAHLARLASGSRQWAKTNNPYVFLFFSLTLSPPFLSINNTIYKMLVYIYRSMHGWCSRGAGTWFPYLKKMQGWCELLLIYLTITSCILHTLRRKVFFLCNF